MDSAAGAAYTARQIGETAVHITSIGWSGRKRKGHLWQPRPCR